MSLPTAEYAAAAVVSYLSSKVNYPFFLVVGDEKYIETKNCLFDRFSKLTRVSEFCAAQNGDKRPNVDRLMEDVRNSIENTAVIGFGEYLALCGQSIAQNRLSTLRDMVLPKSKSIFLLRGVQGIIRGFYNNDPHRFDNRRFLFVGNATTDIVITFVDASLNLTADNGIKSLLERLENGDGIHFALKTNLTFDSPLLIVHRIISAYDGIKAWIPLFSLSAECGNDEQWSNLLTELTSEDGDIERVFGKYGFNNSPESYFDVYIHGDEYKNWLYFIALKLKLSTINNNYLKFVLQNTGRFTDFASNILSKILEVHYDDINYDRMYVDRKKLVEKFSEPQVASFVVETRKKPRERIYYLTDGTDVEKKETISYFSVFNGNEVYNLLKRVYPALSQYLYHYDFNCESVPGDLRAILADYFNSYKKQKLQNEIFPEFEETVLSFAQPDNRIYNRLSSRNEIIDKIQQSGTFLYWLDALGMEFLGFIQSKCAQMGLALTINIARAEIPTITSMNRDFYENWQGEHKCHNIQLDDIKHKDSGGYDYRKSKLPIHLARELDIITEMLEFAETKLALHQYDRFVITSDHGASRLAVIKECELKYETNTKGEHSGRCCKYFEADDLPNAAVENDYLALADYGRFKGSRAANVEVHGGASLEEVLVPVIELRLKDNSIRVQLVDTKVISNFKKKPEIVLYSANKLKAVSVVVKNKRYSAEKTDDNHFKILLADLRAGDYSAEVFDGDNLIGQVEFSIVSASGTINDSFDL